MSTLDSLMYLCINEILTKLGAAMPFKSQWQKLKEDILGHGLISMSP